MEEKAVILRFKCSNLSWEMEEKERREKIFVGKIKIEVNGGKKMIQKRRKKKESWQDD